MDEALKTIKELAVKDYKWFDKICKYIEQEEDDIFRIKLYHLLITRLFTSKFEDNQFEHLIDEETNSRHYILVSILLETETFKQCYNTNHFNLEREDIEESLDKMYWWLILVREHLRGCGYVYRRLKNISCKELIIDLYEVFFNELVGFVQTDTFINLNDYLNKRIKDLCGYKSIEYDDVTAELIAKSQDSFGLLKEDILNLYIEHTSYYMDVLLDFGRYEEALQIENLVGYDQYDFDLMFRGKIKLCEHALVTYKLYYEHLENFESLRPYIEGFIDAKSDYYSLDLDLNEVDDGLEDDGTDSYAFIDFYLREEHLLLEDYKDITVDQLLIYNNMVAEGLLSCAYMGMSIDEEIGQEYLNDATEKCKRNYEEQMTIQSRYLYGTVLLLQAKHYYDYKKYDEAYEQLEYLDLLRLDFVSIDANTLHVKYIDVIHDCYQLLKRIDLLSDDSVDPYIEDAEKYLYAMIQEDEKNPYEFNIDYRRLEVQLMFCSNMASKCYSLKLEVKGFNFCQRGIDLWRAYGCPHKPVDMYLKYVNQMLDVIGEDQ